MQESNGHDLSHGLHVSFFLLFDFYYYEVRQFLVKFFFEIFWGNLPFGPLKNLKNSRFSKVTPHDPL